MLLSSIVWLGLDDRKAEGKFTWLDGTAPTFTYWRPSEPNDHRNGEDCAEVSYLPTIYYTLPYFTAHNCVIIFCQVSFASYLLRTCIAIFTLYSLCLFYIVYCTLFNAHSAIVCNVFFFKNRLLLTIYWRTIHLFIHAIYFRLFITTIYDTVYCTLCIMYNILHTIYCA